MNSLEDRKNEPKETYSLFEKSTEESIDKSIE